MSQVIEEPSVADLLAKLADSEGSEYAERVAEQYEAIEAVYTASLPAAVPVGLSASANPRL